MATSTTVFSRVTIVAPRTRIDVALPADVAVADLMPLIVEMANERTPDGGSRHGGWVLAKLADASPLDPARTLASLGVVDGELLQLRKRTENPPPPLYDDVVDAVAAADPDNYRPWTPETAKKMGHVAGGLALIGCAVALFMGGTGSAVAAAIIAGITAIACVVVGSTIAKAYKATSTGVVIAAAGGLPLAFVSGFYIVPGITEAPKYLLGSVFVLIVAAACILIMGHGLSVFIAAATAGAIGALAFLVSVIFPDLNSAGIAAVTAAVALGLISALPRATAVLAKLPNPVIPSTAEELKEDSGFPDFSEIEQKTNVAHEYMTGLLIGCGAVVAISAIIAAPAGWMGALLAVAATLALLLRARTYANGAQAIALLTTGIVAATGIGLGWIRISSPTTQLIFVFGALLVLAAGALVVGVIFPHQRFSPPLRRSVEILEAACVAIVLPLALGVLGLYDTLRAAGSGILG